MQKLIALAVLLVVMSGAYANDNIAKLRLNIANATDNNYLCLTDVNCVNISMGNQGTEFAMSPSEIASMIMVDISNRHMYPQSLPASCQVTLEKNQTLIVSGKIVRAKDKDGMATISQLKCEVV